MLVYHGSYTEIRDIDLSMTSPRKDFGKGFYVTKFRKQAEEWAERIGKKHGSKGVVTEFTFYENAFIDGVHKVLRFEGYTDEWLDFVVSNRRLDSPVPAHDYDIVEGPVADDKISRHITAYIDGDILKEDFFKSLVHPAPTHQICFCTSDSLLMIKRQEGIDIKYAISNIGEPLVEQLMLDRQIDEIKAADLFYTSATFTQLADTDTKLYEKDWQEIYQMLKKELV
ncbi:MAG: DUF3990 domain-containing protein [Bacteroidales bacterium]|jgi:hypothetical protein|nr:DUF3990 domain-containing protein [Bacteroidales bacterium]